MKNTTKKTRSLGREDRVFLFDTELEIIQQ